MSAGGLRRFLFGSLRRQLVLGIAAVHAVLMTVFVADLVLQQRDMLEARQVDEARTLARSLALSSSAWLLSRDLAGLGELLDVKRSSESVEYAMLTDADGRILAHTERQRIGQYLADLPAVPAGADAGVRVLSRSLALVDVLAPVRAGERHVGWVRVGVGPANAAERMSQAMRKGVLYTLVAILLGVLAAIFMANRLTARLASIGETARAVSAGRYDARAPEAGWDETAVVACGFNAMLETLVAERANLHTLIETVPDMVWSKDVYGVYLNCNRMVERMLGRDRAAIIGCRDEDLLPAELASGYREWDRRVIESGQPHTCEEWVVFKDTGQRVLLETVKVPLFGEGGRLIGVLGVARDITERKRIETRLHLLASVFTASREGVLISDAENRILDVNPAFTEVTGYSREDVLGQNPRILSSGRHDPEFYRRMWQALHEQGAWRGEVWNRNKQGHIFPEHLSITTVHDDAGRLTHYVALMTDISQIKAHEQELDRMAHYDPLTGLFNRRLLGERIRQAMEHALHSGVPFALMLMDLDGFKPVNDRYGHDAGDLVLKEVGKRLRRRLRAGDTAARLGGDEFVLVLQGIGTVDECAHVFDRLLHETAEPISLSVGTVSVSASLGATLFPHDEAEPDDLLRHADQAMYAAKQAGRNCWRIFDPETAA